MTITIWDMKILADLPLEIKTVESFGSWRWNYEEAVVILNDSDSYVPISDIHHALDELTSGREFWGYKGGTFKYTDDTPLHFEYDFANVSDEPLAKILSPSSLDYLKNNPGVICKELLHDKDLLQKILEIEEDEDDDF